MPTNSVNSPPMLRSRSSFSGTQTQERFTSGPISQIYRALQFPTNNLRGNNNTRKAGIRAKMKTTHQVREISFHSVEKQHVPCFSDTCLLYCHSWYGYPSSQTGDRSSLHLKSRRSIGVVTRIGFRFAIFAFSSSPL